MKRTLKTHEAEIPSYDCRRISVMSESPEAIGTDQPLPEEDATAAMRVRASA
jgi:hypothetical protein